MSDGTVLGASAGARGLAGVAGEQAVSFEVTAKDSARLAEAAAFVPRGTQLSVTFLPGETVAARVEAAMVARALGFSPMPHLSARRLESSAALEAYLAALRDAADIDRAFVIAGDPPSPLGPYADALAIIRSGLLEKYGVRKVGIAGYPEGHAMIDDATLWSSLEVKCAALIEAGHEVEIITQFGFDAEPILAWLERVRALGIEAPVRVGIPGPASVKTLLRFAANCGVAASARALSRFGISLAKVLGSARPDRLVETLLGGLERKLHGDVRLHVYTFGGPLRAAEWMHDFSARGQAFSAAASRPSPEGA